ncbi:IS66 family insertion sequence element accessory protein TnpA [Adlercreutzia sp. ZJ141]|uniref:IS66 family insertion sequence element accessory protein TnpA n=1 Tax=Adlercreutzia sp. ZJ141 TaxID=2709406 RepID=UPI003F8D55B4
MAPQERRSMRREQVERCLAANMTIKEWCTLNKVARSTMYAWMAKFRKEEPELFGKPNSHEWIELSRESISSRTALSRPVAVPGVSVYCAEDSACSSPSTIIVRMRDISVSVPVGCSADDIASVLRVVASL